jgi:hypothetical protein
MATAGAVAGPKEVFSAYPAKREPRQFRDLFTALVTSTLNLFNKLERNASPKRLYPVR